MTSGKGICLCVGLLLGAGPARAEWPWLTEEAGNRVYGQFSLSTGVQGAIQKSDLLPGGKGTLIAFPDVEFRLGLGPRAEVSFQYDWFWLYPSGKDVAYSESGDLRVWTKIGLFSNERWKTALRFGAKLPNASDEHGIGTDNTDFFAAGLVDLRLGPTLVSANLGLGILGSTELNQSQDDVLTWGLSLRYPVGESFQMGLEGAGTMGPWGLRQKRSFVTVGAGAGWRAGSWRFDLALRRGFADALGWSGVAGVTFDK